MGREVVRLVVSQGPPPGVWYKQYTNWYKQQTKSVCYEQHTVCLVQTTQILSGTNNTQSPSGTNNTKSQSQVKSYDLVVCHARGRLSTPNHCQARHPRVDPCRVDKTHVGLTRLVSGQPDLVVSHARGQVSMAHRCQVVRRLLVDPCWVDSTHVGSTGN